MATSAFFSINKYVVLDYIYDSMTLASTTDTFRKIVNGYANGETSIVNKDDMKLVTKNVADNAVVRLDNAKYVLLDVDGPYFYPNLDPNISVQDITIPTTFPVIYDKIRIHILSGYQFPNLFGFIASIFCRQSDGSILRLSNLSYTRSDFDLLYFNPQPLKMAEFIYDKFVEFLVPSQNYMLQQQLASPGSSMILPYFLSSGKFLATQQIIYCEYHNITDITDTNGIRQFSVDEAVLFSLSSADKFNLLVARIFKAEDGDYFEYYAEYDSDLIEDFIYKINSVAGNKFYIIHELSVIEQIGSTFTRTQTISHVQVGDYSKQFKFKPVLDNADQATSFSLEYTIRFYNSSDGKSIFKTSTLTSSEVAKFSKKGGIKLNVGDSNAAIKVYNRR